MKRQLQKLNYVINPKLIVQELKDQVLIFDPEKSTLLTLNETASLIFILIKKGHTIEDIVSQIMNKYTTEYNQAKIEAKAFIKELKQNKVIM